MSKRIKSGGLTLIMSNSDRGHVVLCNRQQKLVWMVVMNFYISK